MENQMKPHQRNGLKSILTSGWNGFRLWNHWPFSTFLLGSFLIDFFYSQQKSPLSSKDEPSVPVTPSSDPVPGAPVTPKEAEDGKKVEYTCENLFPMKTLLSVRNVMKSKEVRTKCCWKSFITYAMSYKLSLSIHERIWSPENGSSKKVKYSCNYELII